MISTLSEITQLWEKALKQIKIRLAEDALFDSFFQDSYIYNINGDTITIIVNSELAVQLMQSKYYDLISDVISDLTETSFKFAFVEEGQIANINNPQVIKKQTYFNDSYLNDSLTFDNFVVGAFNREAYQAALMVSRTPGKMFNPLFIYSNSGLGKTHLLHAIGNYIAKNGAHNNKVLCINANDFLEEYVRYCKGEKESESLKDYICGFDILLLDDVQLLADKVKTQELFFTVFQKLIDSGKQVVLTSDKHPNQLKSIEDRLITRFTKGLVISIKEPDQKTCVEILQKKIESIGLDLSKFEENVLYFYADKFSKNIRELEGALNSLIFHSIDLNEHDIITMDVASEAVKDLIGGNSLSTQINEQKIINIVANYYQLNPSQLTGTSRTAQITLPRHIAQYLIKEELDIPYKKIADMFGGKDHTTIMYSIKNVEKKLKEDEKLQEAINELKKQISK